MFVVIEIYDDVEPAEPRQIAPMVQFVGNQMDVTNQPTGQNVNMRWAVLTNEQYEESDIDIPKET